jgi:hypothetical protein
MCRASMIETETSARGSGLTWSTRPAHNFARKRRYLDAEAGLTMPISRRLRSSGNCRSAECIAGNRPPRLASRQSMASARDQEGSTRRNLKHATCKAGPVASDDSYSVSPLACFAVLSIKFVNTLTNLCSASEPPPSIAPVRSTSTILNAARCISDNVPKAVGSTNRPSARTPTELIIIPRATLPANATRCTLLLHRSLSSQAFARSSGVDVPCSTPLALALSVRIRPTLGQ